MGPKRKSTAAGSSKSAKRAKTEPGKPESRWEYEGDKQTWTQYSDTINTLLHTAFDGNKKQVDFTLPNGVELSVNFDKSVQKNKKTGWERPVRLAVKDDTDDSYYVWNWEDEKGKYNPYGPKVTLLLETGRKDSEGVVEIDAMGRSYSVDLDQMKQTNKATKVKRTVVREESNAVKADPDAPVPVASSTSDTPAKGGKGTRSGRGKSGGKVKAEPEEEEEEEEEVKTVAKSKSGKSGARERPAVKTMIMTGKAPVDAECTSLVGKAHVFYDGKDVWDCMLNQTNVSNNNNKYFVIQLLEHDSQKSFYVWFRWGRVGYPGQSNLVPHGPNLDAAKKTFMKKFSDKTKNNWSYRHLFYKHPGKYDLLEMDYSAKNEDEVDAPIELKKTDSVKTPDSKLDKKLQDLVNLICDVQSMEEAVMEMQYDAKKAPLGKLTTDQIKAGYAALKKIDACITKKDTGYALTQACDEFYTRIPHDFGMRPPSKITTKEEVKKKISLLELLPDWKGLKVVAWGWVNWTVLALGDIQIAFKMLKQGDMSENPVDRHYHSLKCDLQPMDHSSGEFKMIEKYLQNTHAATHNQYKMKILDVFDVSKHGEKEKFNDCGNRMLLWHGSRLTNWVGILSQGLRIAPPEAPVTGYMFGKGVYFADMSSKSANYCFATRNKKTGLLLLCDVALGNTNDLLAADYAADKLPSGKHSVKGAGAIAPDASDTTKTPDGALVPWGKGKNTGVKNPKGYTLNYNEFIVYDTKQIKMKYLIKLDFNFR